MSTKESTTDPLATIEGCGCRGSNKTTAYKPIQKTLPKNQLLLCTGHKRLKLLSFCRLPEPRDLVFSLLTCGFDGKRLPAIGSLFGSGVFIFFECWRLCVHGDIDVTEVVLLRGILIFNDTQLCSFAALLILILASETGLWVAHTAIESLRPTCNIRPAENVQSSCSSKSPLCWGGSGVNKGGRIGIEARP